MRAYEHAILGLGALVKARREAPSERLSTLEQLTAAPLTHQPRLVGPHELRITIITVEVPRVHVLITDPLKTDGKRMKGY